MKSIKKICQRNLPLIFAAVLVILAGCASHPQISEDLEAYLYPAESYLPENFEWQEVRPGISRFDFENPDFPVVYHAVRINLATEGLDIVCFPDKKFAQKKSGIDENSADDLRVPQPFIYRGKKTRAFALQNECVVAMNATPFGGKNGKWDFAAKIGATRQIVGVHIADKFQISAPVRNYAALVFRRAQENQGDFIAEVVDFQSDDFFADCDYAFGGFFMVLRDGKVQDFKVRTHDSRSGAGVSADGRILYLLVVEGEFPKKSEGLSYPQCGEIFKAMGCANALEFDGGSSSQLYINGKNAMNYSTIVVQGNSFGFTVCESK